MFDNWIAGRMGLQDEVFIREMADEWILSELRRTVAYASAHSSYYREHFSQCAESAASGDLIRSFEDFAQLPFTAPADIVKHGPQMLCTTPDNVRRIVTLTTSGSAGDPKRIYFTDADLEMTIDYFHHGMAEFAGPGMKAAILFPGRGENGLNDLLSQALIRLGCQYEIFGYPDESRYDELIEMILEGGVDFLIGPARAIAGAAGYSESNGSAGKLSGRIRGVLLAAEYVSEENKRETARIWDCRVYEHYGMTESGLAGAVGLRTGTGYRVWESGVYYEIVDPKTGRAVPDGEYGEIVVTTLCREAMPIIRYRTGDVSRFVVPDSGERISDAAGSGLKIIDRVQSRPDPKKYAPRSRMSDEIAF